MTNIGHEITEEVRTLYRKLNMYARLLDNEDLTTIIGALSVAEWEAKTEVDNRVKETIEA